MVIKATTGVLHKAWGSIVVGQVGLDIGQGGERTMRMLLAIVVVLDRTLRGIAIDHKQEAFLGRRKLGNVVVGMSSADMLLHGTKALLLEQAPWPVSVCQHDQRVEETYAKAALATDGAIVVVERTEHLMRGFGSSRRRAGEGRLGRHDRRGRGCGCTERAAA